MDITKSTRHQKIIGHFGESLICNWLSRSGFEVSLIDHTGIDIVAYRPDVRLGISVKSRTRVLGAEKTSVRLFTKNDREKVQKACTAFACDPWLALYIEATTYAEVFLTSLENYDKNYKFETASMESWKMGANWQAKYLDDPMVKHIRLNFDFGNWNW
jgi:Holliday junction resolvase-like predicted endonuclease